MWAGVSVLCLDRQDCCIIIWLMNRKVQVHEEFCFINVKYMKKELISRLIRIFN